MTTSFHIIYLRLLAQESTTHKFTDHTKSEKHAKILLDSTMINCIVSKNNWSELVLVLNSLHIHKEDSSQSEICGRHSSRMTQHDHWTTALNAINVMREKMQRQ